MGGLFSRIFLLDLVRGLRVTFRNQNPKYIYTERYPTERPKASYTREGGIWDRQMLEEGPRPTQYK